MQYCTKCQNLVADQIAVCPHCKRTKSLRQAKATDSVFLMKTTEFEAGELAEAFEAHGVPCRVVPYSSGLVSSLYDSQVMPTDKNVFVDYAHMDTAKAVMDRLYAENPEPPPEDDMPRGKRLAIQVVSVVAFLLLVSLVVFGADALANGLKSLFSGG